MEDKAVTFVCGRGVFGNGGSNDVTAIFVTWPEVHVFAGGLP